MNKKELLIPLYVKGNASAYRDGKDYRYNMEETLKLAVNWGNSGADALVIFDQSEGDQEHDAAIGLIREISRAIDIPLYAGGSIHRLEDVKKLLYAGCRKVFLNYAKKGNVALTKEASERFGKEKILACTGSEEELSDAVSYEEYIGGILIPAFKITEDEKLEKILNSASLLYYCVSYEDSASKIFKNTSCAGAGAFAYAEADFYIMDKKYMLCEEGFDLNLFESSLTWADIRTNNDGLLPVVVQDYKTQEVLMVAYMNEEAFDLTVRTGRMTYWSRSRQEIWVKGLTSGHFQYVKELCIDCDNDTLLAKVAQVGAACHTGNRTCFYRSVMKKEYDNTNPMKVFSDVYSVIEDRKIHPKEGSYTNYLFDKGIDKILKKLGEEATEIVIAAKNPDPEEIKYEISDFLYHAMVLMVERGVTWEDITKELARR